MNFCFANLFLTAIFVIREKVPNMSLRMKKKYPAKNKWHCFALITEVSHVCHKFIVGRDVSESHTDVSVCVTLNKQTEKVACKAPSALPVSGPEWPPSLALVRRSAQSLFLAAATNYPQLWPPLQRLRNDRQLPLPPSTDTCCFASHFGQLTSTETAEEASAAAAAAADTLAINFF